MQCHRNKCLISQHLKSLRQMDSWQWKPGTINEQFSTSKLPWRSPCLAQWSKAKYGDTLDESHMPLGWPMSIDGAVRQILHAQTRYHPRIEQHASGVQPPTQLRRDQSEHKPVGAQCCMEQKVHGPRSRTIPTATMGCLRTLHLPKSVQIQGCPWGSDPPNG